MAGKYPTGNIIAGGTAAKNSDKIYMNGPVSSDSGWVDRMMNMGLIPQNVGSVFKAMVCYSD